MHNKTKIYIGGTHIPSNMKRLFLLTTLVASSLSASPADRPYCQFEDVQINEIGFSGGLGFVELLCTNVGASCHLGLVSLSVGIDSSCGANGICAIWGGQSQRVCKTDLVECFGPGCGGSGSWNVPNSKPIRAIGGTIQMTVKELDTVMTDGETKKHAVRVQRVDYGEIESAQGSWGLPNDDPTREYSNLQSYFHEHDKDHLSENHVLSSSPGKVNKEAVFLRCNANRGTAVGLLGDPEDLSNRRSLGEFTKQLPRANCNGHANEYPCATRNEIDVRFVDDEFDEEAQFNIEEQDKHTIYSSKKLYLGGELQLSQFIDKIKLPAVYGHCLAEETHDDGFGNTDSHGSRLRLRLLITEHFGKDRSEEDDPKQIAAGDLLNTLRIVYDLTDKNDPAKMSSTRKLLAVSTSTTVTTIDIGDLGTASCTHSEAAYDYGTQSRLVDLGYFGSEQAINVLSIQRVASNDKDDQPYGRITVRLVATEEADDRKKATMVSPRALSIKMPMIPNALNKYAVEDDYRKATEFRGISVWEDDTNGGIRARVALNTLFYASNYSNPHWRRCVPQVGDNAGMGWADDDDGVNKQVELHDYCAKGDVPAQYGGSQTGGNHNGTELGAGCTSLQYQVFHNGPYSNCTDEKEKITEGDRYVSVVHFGQCGAGQQATFRPDFEFNKGDGIVVADFDNDNEDGQILRLGNRACYASDLVTEYDGLMGKDAYDALYVDEPRQYSEFTFDQQFKAGTRYPAPYGFWATTELQQTHECSKLVNGNGTEVSNLTPVNGLKTHEEVCKARTGHKVDGVNKACATTLALPFASPEDTCKQDENSRMFYQGVEYAADVNLDELHRSCRATRKTSSGRGVDTYHFSVAHTLLKPDVRGKNYVASDSADYFRSECVQADYMVAVNTKLRAQLTAEFGNNIDVMIVSATLEPCDGSDVEGAGVDRDPNGLNDGCTDERECVDGAYRLKVELQIDNLVLNNQGGEAWDNFKYVGIRSANDDLKSRGSTDNEDLDGNGVAACTTTRNGHARGGTCKSGPLSPSTYERMMASTSAYGFADEVRGSNQATSTMREITKSLLASGDTVGDTTQTGFSTYDRTDVYVRQVVTLTTGCFKVLDVNDNNKCDADLFHTQTAAVQHAAATVVETLSNYDLDVRFHACTTKECLAGGNWTREGGANLKTQMLCNDLCHERRHAPGTQGQQGGQGTSEGYAFFPLDLNLRHTECPEVILQAEENLHATSELQLYPGIQHPRTVDGSSWGAAADRDYFEPYSKYGNNSDPKDFSEAEQSDIEFGPAQTIVATIEAKENWVVNSRTVWIRRARLCLVNEGTEVVNPEGLDASPDAQDRTRQGCDNVGTTAGTVKEENTYLLVEEGKRFSYEEIYGRDFFHVVACKSMELMTNSGGTPASTANVTTSQLNSKTAHAWRYGLGFDAQTATTHTHRLCGVTDDGLESKYWGLDTADENEEENRWAEVGGGGGNVSQSFAKTPVNNARPTGYTCHWDGIRAGNVNARFNNDPSSESMDYKKNAWDALSFSADYLVELVNKDAGSNVKNVATQTWLLDIEAEMVDCRSTLMPHLSGSNKPKPKPKSTPMLRALIHISAPTRPYSN